jgi:hypothetical protein
MKRTMAIMLSMALAGSVIAAQDQQSTTTAAKKPQKKSVARKSAPTLSEQLNQMKEAIDAQQQQIRQLSDQVQNRDQKIQQLEQRLDQSQTTATQAQTKADSAVAQAAEEQQSVDQLKSDLAGLKTVSTGQNQAVLKNALYPEASSDGQAMSNVEPESPAAIRFKGITITPGGFLAAESIYRTRALGADINTPFNSVSMPGSAANEVSEFYGSGRQSRITMLAEGKISTAKLSGYYEADFLGTGVTSTPTESNSYVLRQRQVWGQAALDNGWSFTGGQMWSLVTETKKGVENRTEATPLTIDPAYTVGFSWARQYGFRVAKNFNNQFWLAASLENPQTSLSETNAASNFAFGSPGNDSGLYNGAAAAAGGAIANYSFNAMPDVIAKAVWEPGFGHYEVFGILSRFRDRVYPCVEFLAGSSLCTGGTAVTGAYNDSKNGGGVGGNARVTIAKQLDFGLHALYGSGVGRYGASTLPDATVNPDGTLAPLRSYQGLATLEWHTPRLDVYLNGGEEYVAKRFQTDPVSGKVVGYGAPSFNDSNCYTETAPTAGNGYSFGGLTCSGNTQSTIEGTFGFWYRVYHGPKGRIQLGPQYSYVVRNAYPGTGNTPGTFVDPHGIENMFFTSFRYYLP